VDGSTANDSDFIEDAAANSTCEIGLSSVTDPGVDTGHIIRFRMYGTGSGGPERCEVQLWSGGSSRAATGNQVNRGSWGTKTYTLSEAEAATLTYSDLSVKVVASNMAAEEAVDVSWIEVEVPDAGGTTHTETITDTLGLSDSVLINVKHRRTITETLGFSDSVLATVKHRRVISETLALNTPDMSDISKIVEVPYSADTLGLSDSVASSVQAGNITQTVTDTLGLSDSVVATVKHRRAVSDTLGLSDSVATATSGVLAETVTDTLGLSDTVVATVKHRRVVSDTLGLSDSVSSALAGTETAAVTETLGFSDSVVIAVKHRRVLTDTLALSDSVVQPTAGMLMRYGGMDGGIGHSLYDAGLSGGMSG
jgi:hypothetical protein